MTYKKYLVCLDRPGAGWSETIKAKNIINALINANSKHKNNPATISDVREITKEEIRSEKVWNLIKEYKRKLNTLKNDYEIQKRVETVLYNQKLNSIKKV